MAFHITYVHGLNKDPILIGSEINFLEKEAHKLLHPYNDALVITVIMENIKFNRIIFDTSSLVDIMFYEAWKDMKYTHPQRLVKTPLLEFFEFSMTPEGSITLLVTIG